MRGLAALICVALWTVPSWADNAAEATRLFEEGKALRDQGNWTEACAKFGQSYALNRKPGTQLNLGECAERESQFRRAWLLFDDAAREYDRIRIENEARVAKEPTNEAAKQDMLIAAAGAKHARQRAESLTPKLAKVVVRMTEPRLDGLAVRIGDRAVPPAAAIVELLDAGSVSITASAPGREPFSTTVTAEMGKQVEVEIPGLRASEAGGGGAVGGERKKSRVKLAYALVGGGATVIIASGLIGLVARSDYNEAEARCMREGGQLLCSQADADAIDSAGSKADAATYLGIAGAAVLVSGVIVYFTAPREGITVTPMASPSGAGVSFSGRF